MRKVMFTGTDLEVSLLALGTAHFGSGISMAQAFEQLDTYVAYGGNIIDTAHAYGNWISGLDSPSEEAIGEWLKKSRKRNQVLVSTKGGHPNLNDMTRMRVDITSLESDLDASLKKMNIDYFDMYFLHRDDPTVPVEELLEWLEEKVRIGKIRYYGCSNWSFERLKEAQMIAASKGFHGFSCNQAIGCLADVHPETLPPFNIVMDKKIREYHESTQLSFMAYMALSRGYFMKRLAEKPISEENLANYTAKSNDKIVEKLRMLCDGEYSALDFYYQYLIHQKFPTVAIAGFSSKKQIEEAVASIECNMPSSLLLQVAELKELQ